MSAANTSPDQAEIQHVLDILHRWGIHTLGQLAELDKDELGRRLGPTAVHLWERANGKSIRLLKLVPPVESFAETFEFENEIETAEPLLFMLRRFLEQLSARLAAFYLVAKELTLKINFSDKKHLRTSFSNSATDRKCGNTFPDGCRRIWKISPPTRRSSPWRSRPPRRRPPRNNLVCLKRPCAIRCSSRKRSRG